MTLNARFVHTNLVARDWQRLARFYQEVLGCVLVPPERDLSGGWIDEATAMQGVHIRGAHLRLPGSGPNGPTLEIFQYDALADGPAPLVNRPGWGHLAFSVDDVPAAVDAMLTAGGGLLGEVVRTTIPGAGTLQFAYATDPEGNIVELQAWEDRNG